MFQASAVVVLLTIYATYVRFLRHRRSQAIETKYLSTWQRGCLTPRQAQEIVHSSLFYESPLMMRIGIQVALFKVYGIPAVSALLIKTGQLKSPETISRRIADTATLIATWITCPLVGPGSGDESILSTENVDPRGAIAVARVNFLHNKYNIANDDFLYNLALFIHEPIDWTTRYDWRAHTPLERDAIFIFWKEIARRMGIRDVWNTFEDMVQWAADYEAIHMVPSTSSNILAETTFGFFLRRLPDVLGIRIVFKKAAICLLDQRLREAMMLPTPPSFLQSSVHAILIMRGLFVRYLCIPRRTPALYVTLDNPSPGPAGTPSETVPRMHATYRRPIPWYWPQSTGLRLALENLQVKLGFRSAESLPGPKWKSQGYRLEEMGPVGFENEGKKQVFDSAAAIQGQPVTGSWSLDGGKDPKALKFVTTSG